MLLSMTGHGDASAQNDRLAVTAEIRSVNNRHFKLSLRCPESFVALESQVEKLVRQTISRGTVSINLRIRHLAGASSYHLNPEVAAQYAQQAAALADDLLLDPPTSLAELLALPGVVDEGEFREIEESDWPLIETVLSAAVAKFHEFRRSEGRVMADELLSLCQDVEDHAARVAARAPGVVDEYRQKLKARVGDLLQSNNITLQDSDVLREITLFADRCDITEELTRLRSHLQQYRQLVAAEGSQGRKLDFLGQELFREVNTIGSKANDVEIAHLVVNMKAAVEKLRELIQNVE